VENRASYDLVGGISKDKVGKAIPLSFSDANPLTSLFGTVRRKKTVINKAKYRFESA
jgi:hypothetical protein